jgi:glycosyltransferase involved in cell wall biosynthesis
MSYTTSPLITIIIATYNRKALLEKAILSVINQKKDIPYTWELFIVDDASTDGTQEHIQQYLDAYPNISYVRQEHAGIPWVARNKWIELMSPESAYTFFLDDDDEFMPDLFNFCLLAWQKLKDEHRYEQVLWFYFLCQNEQGEVIWSKKILQKKTEKSFTYDDYLLWAINIEMWLVTKSELFNWPLHLRFSEEVITEGVMWCKMWQYMEKHGLIMLLRDYVGRLYRTNHVWHSQITKTFTSQRFLNNAKGNELIFGTIASDLDRKWLMHIKSDYDIRIGINYLLGGEKKLWLHYMNEAVHTTPSVKTFLLRVLANTLPQKWLQKLYVWYIS